MKINVRKFDPAILDNATLISNSGTMMDTYNLNNGYILKKMKPVNPLNMLLHYFFAEKLLTKIMSSQSIESPYLVLPQDVFLANDDFVGYTVPFIDMKNFDDYLSTSRDLDFITDSFLALSNAVRECNEEGIVLPDMGTTSNVLYDPASKKIKFIDFDGIQVKNHMSFSVSNFMNSTFNKVFEGIKYFDAKKFMFTTNFDMATLLTLFLHYTTRTNVIGFAEGIDFDEDKDGKQILSEASLFKYLYLTGIYDTPIEEDIRLIYDSDRDNRYLDESIKSLRKTHNLVDYPRKSFVVK